MVVRERREAVEGQGQGGMVEERGEGREPTQSPKERLPPGDVVESGDEEGMARDEAPGRGRESGEEGRGKGTTMDHQRGRRDQLGAPEAVQEEVAYQRAGPRSTAQRSRPTSLAGPRDEEEVVEQADQAQRSAA